MRQALHGAFAGLLAIVTALLVWMWFESGQCGALSCGFSLNQPNNSFISLGILAAFLFCVESVNIVTRRKQWNLGYESERQRKLHRFGTWSILGGILPAVYGLIKLNSTLVSCPASGCSASGIFDIIAPYYITFYLGLFLIALGAVLILVSKLVLPEVKIPQFERPLSQRV